ncbi:MAG: hypothetical protein WCD79_23630 [Chthoniobacteraceae bacterium]
MKHSFFIPLMTLFSLHFCNAEDPKPKPESTSPHYSITVNYVTPDGKKVSSSSSNLAILLSDLPLNNVPWVVHVDSDYSNPESPSNMVNVMITDPSRGPQTNPPLTIFSGHFSFQSGKEITVLKTTDYFITLTATELPADKK